MELMNIELEGLEDFTISYLDDIFSVSPEEHLLHSCTVSDRLMIQTGLNEATFLSWGLLDQARSLVFGSVLPFWTFAVEVLQDSSL